MAFAAALLALSVWPSTQPAYVARGRAVANSDLARHAVTESDLVLYVYRIAPGGTPQPVVNGVIGSHDELAFAYLNHSGWSRILVYGVDEAGRIYWYHPGWTEAADTPVAVPIDTGWHELPEAIAQPLPYGRLEIHAVFTDGVVTVQEIERGERPTRVQELVLHFQVTKQAWP